jgi:hypothetical protein
MIKKGDLVRYSWDETPGLVIEVKEKDRGTIGISVMCLHALVLWPDNYGRKKRPWSGRSSNIWWVPIDKYLKKVC